MLPVTVKPMDPKPLSLLERVLLPLCTALLIVLRVFSDYIMFPLLSAIKSGRSELQPRVTDEILLMSAADLAEKIRSGEVNSFLIRLLDPRSARKSL